MVPQPPNCVLGGLGVHEANVSSASVATGGARARVLLVLSPGLSLDPKPKVVRPKPKLYLPKKVKCHSIPTLLLSI